MRILHLLPTNKFSGAENVACQIINLFSGNTDYEMAYCSPDGPIRKSVEEKGIRFISLESFSFRQARKAIGEFKPDLIHAHDLKASLLAVLVGRSVPVVSHVHVNSEDNHRLSIRSLAYLYAFTECKHIFWVSNSAYKEFYFNNIINK